MLEEIGESTFETCNNLQTITLPNTLEEIGDNAFKDCGDLVDVILLNDSYNITNIGTNVFEGCNSSLEIAVSNNWIPEYKNATNWSNYKSNIVPLEEYDEIDLYSNRYFDFETLLNAGECKIYKLDTNILNSGIYQFNINANDPINVTLYDDEFNIVNYEDTDSNTRKTKFNINLSNNEYYIVLQFLSKYKSGIITTEIDTYTIQEDNEIIDLQEIKLFEQSLNAKECVVYELEIETERNYEFLLDSLNSLDVKLYKQDTNSLIELSYVDLNSSAYKIHFNNVLEEGTYYLRVKYLNNTISGIVNTKINILDVTHTYNLSNYGTTINQSNEINVNSYHFYKLNIGYSKYYELDISSDKSINVTLYDDLFNEIEYTDLNVSNLVVKLIPNLTSSSYYLKVTYTDQTEVGLIDVMIKSRESLYPTYNTDIDILVNYYNNLDTYIYGHGEGTGFYKITLDIEKLNNTLFTFSSNTIDAYDDSGNLLNIVTNGKTLAYIYLERGQRVNIKINLPNELYTKMIFKISQVEDAQILDYSNNMLTTNMQEIFSLTNVSDYLKKVTISHLSSMTIDVLSSSNITSTYNFVLYKQTLNGLQTLINEPVTPTNRSPQFNLTLEEGIYYVGYVNNTNNIEVRCTFTRNVDTNINPDGVIVSDPYLNQGFVLGTEVTMNEGILQGNTVTEGFTRCLYLFTENGLVNYISRLDCEWYSSNESVAKVTDYGTILGMNVNQDTSVYIYAIYKDDPSRVFRYQLIVLNDTSGEEIEIHSTLTYKKNASGKYDLILNIDNSPYPMIQEYYWTMNKNCCDSTIDVTMNYFGEISTQDVGCFTLTGSYYLNSRVTLIIHVVIEE